MTPSLCSSTTGDAEISDSYSGDTTDGDGENPELKP